MPSSPLILVTDNSECITGPLAKLLEKAGYRVLTDGEECLKITKEKHPQLIILDIMLPKIHGIEVLKTIKTLAETNRTGIIISTGRALYPDYQIAMEYGADYYLTKPFDFLYLIELVNSFFAGTLKPNSFSDTSHRVQDSIYAPHLNFSKSYIKLWGTRGSITVSGYDFHLHGGNTSCLEIYTGDDNCIIIDAGTGIRALGNEVLKRKARAIHLLVGHTHWDHIIGFPFFAPVYTPDFSVDFYGAKGFGKGLKDIFTGMLDRDYFPVRLDEMQAKLTFHELHDDRSLTIGNITIKYTYATHPGATLCFKIISPNKTIGYVTDNEFLVGYQGHPNDISLEDDRLEAYQYLIDFFKDCDILIHEAQYTPKQYAAKIGWGHSSMSNVAILIKFANIKEWIITHHDPDDTDELLRQKLELLRLILEECKISCNVQLAYDGFKLSV
jgi:DNA-binding response OmpR family regulator